MSSAIYTPDFHLDVGFFISGDFRFGRNAGALRVLLFILCALPVFFAGCISPPQVNPDKNLKPQRIISLAPSVTETLFALGAGDRVVGDTTFCDWPPEARALPKIGQFARYNFEAILALKPDMVIATKDAPSETVSYELASYGIPSRLVEAYSIEEIARSIETIGGDIGAEREALALVSDMRRRVDAVRARVAGAPKLKVIVVYDHEPLIIAGAGTFADDIIKIAGGVNIAADAYVKYPNYNIERLVLEGPDVIIEAAQGGGYGKLDPASIVEFWRKWPAIPAVKNNRIAIVDADLVSRPGPRIIDGLEAVAAAIHPELFGNGEK